MEDNTEEIAVPEKINGYYFYFQNGARPIYVETDGEEEPMRDGDTLVLYGVHDLVTLNWAAVAYYMPLQVDPLPTKQEQINEKADKDIESIIQYLDKPTDPDVPKGWGQYL